MSAVWNYHPNKRRVDLSQHAGYSQITYIVKYESRKHLESANLRQAARLNSMESNISCQNYFTWTARFGEVILNYGRAIISGRFFRTAVLTLTSRKLIVKNNWYRFWTYVPNIMKIGFLICEKLQRAPRTNKWTNEPTNTSDHNTSWRRWQSTVNTPHRRMLWILEIKYFMVYTLNISISQGSIETRLRLGGIFNGRFVANFL